jgi:hypothetical protein
MRLARPMQFGLSTSDMYSETKYTCNRPQARGDRGAKKLTVLRNLSLHSGFSQ